MEKLQLSLSLNPFTACDPGDGFSSSDENSVPKKRSFLQAVMFSPAEEDGGDSGGGFVAAGWPPVKRRRGVGSMHVKVNVEGVAITRKVNLGAHGCYSSLACNLASMFGVEWGGHELVYQDSEGDWLLAGDVPWSNFVESVQRMKVFRRGRGDDGFWRKECGLMRL